MRRTPPLPLLAALLALGACASPGPLVPAGETSPVTFRNELSGVPDDAAAILEAATQGDLLRLKVQHGGGCRKHDYGLYVGTVFLESLPVQVHAKLAHDAHGDPCRALVGADLQFDLRPLRERYQQGSPGKGTIVIHLREPGPAGKTHSVRYTF